MFRFLFLAFISLSSPLLAQVEENLMTPQISEQKLQRIPQAEDDRRYHQNLNMRGTVNIRIYYWFNSKASSEFILRSSAIVKTKEMLLSHGITLPDAGREIIFLDPLKSQE